MTHTLNFKATVLLGAIAATALSGCALSGLDADNKFSCQAPPGVTCMSVSGIYANAKQKNLPGLRTDQAASAPSGQQQGAQKTMVNYNGADSASGTASSKYSPRNMGAPNSGQPLRTPVRVLRIWMAPYEDQDGDLHDQQYFYVTVNTGDWAIEANRLNILTRFQHVYPLSANNPANKVIEDAPRPTPQQQAAQSLPANRVNPIEPIERPQ
jgi:conjugal transfer pilus assembly protein TraV